MKRIEGKSIKYVKHNIEKVELDGCIYECRVVKSKDGEELLIGDYDLLYAIHPGAWEDVNEGFVSDEAEDIYDEIFFFTEPDNLRNMSDEELIAELKKDNPEWFN